MLNCVIVDSGVSYNHPLIDRNHLSGFSLIINKDGTVDRKADFNDQYGHGTAIYHILQGLKDDVNFINIRIASIENEGIDEDALLAALTYVEEKCDADVINLSLGTTICNQNNKLYDICKKFDEKGTVILSAFDNDGSISFPAAFDCVIGVVSLDECKKNDDFVYIEDSCINIAGKGNIQRLAWTEPQTVFMDGNSFACAHATKQTLKFMLRGVSGRRNILDCFRSVALAEYNIKPKYPVIKKDFSEWKRAAIFPFNKEMHSLIRYSECLPFEISNVYDLKYSGHVGGTTTAIMHDNSVKSITVENIHDINFDSFDAFIFGHFAELERLVDDTLRKSLLDNLKNHGKKVFSFDDVSQLNYSNVYCPNVKLTDLPPNRMGKLYRINQPVLGVFGTSSSQGKFTLQLRLRELFIQNQYSIGQIGSEPHSELFGMDYAFPMGYNSSVYIDEIDTVLYLNNIMHSLCDRDIVIVGSQANTIPYDFGNIDRYTFKQNSFFMGTMPDAVILLINPYDEQEYIEHTIQYIESFGFCKVIAIVIFPMDIDDHWRRFATKKRPVTAIRIDEIKSQFLDKIPVYLLGNSADEVSLFERIVDYFS